MLKAIFNWFTGKPLPGTTAPDVKPEAAPYKVEAPVQVVPVQEPAPAKCGCGRSQSGLCVGLHKLTADEWNVHADNPNATKPAKKKRAPANKPAAMKAPAKPKAPRKPKAK